MPNKLYIKNYLRYRAVLVILFALLLFQCFAFYYPHLYYDLSIRLDYIFYMSPIALVFVYSIFRSRNIFNQIVSLILALINTYYFVRSTFVFDEWAKENPKLYFSFVLLLLFHTAGVGIYVILSEIVHFVLFIWKKKKKDVES